MYKVICKAAARISNFGNIRLLVLFFVFFLTLFQVCQAAPLEVVVVQGADIKPFDDAVEGFESACDCTISEVIIADGSRSDIAGRVRRLHPDAVLALGVDALVKLQSIRDIPIFYTMTAGARHPLQELNNFSGVSMFITPERQITSIMEVFPRAKRIGIIYDPRHTASLVERTIQYARSHSIEIVAREVHSAREVPVVLDSLNGRIDVLLMLPDTTVVTPETVNSMLIFSFRNGVPLFTFSEKYVEMGAVAALTVSPSDLGAQIGEIARKFMKDRARSAPVRTYARKHVLTINLKVAKKLGIFIPDEIVRRSVKVK